jgi:hypothetical protein
LNFGRRFLAIKSFRQLLSSQTYGSQPPLTINRSQQTTTMGDVGPQFDHPRSITLPTFPKPPPSSSATEIARAWLSKLTTVLNGKWSDVSELSSVFHQDCWWRDHCALSWDLRTIHTLGDLYNFLSPKTATLEFSNAKLRTTGFGTPNLVAVTDSISWVESFITFETATGRGEGVLRLTPDAMGNWKCYVLYTSLGEIKGHEWAMGKRRPHGGKNTIEGDMKHGNWAERRARKREFLDEEPVCLVIGAGKWLFLPLFFYISIPFNCISCSLFPFFQSPPFSTPTVRLTPLPRSIGPKHLSPPSNPRPLLPSHRQKCQNW